MQSCVSSTKFAHRGALNLATTDPHTQGRSAVKIATKLLSHHKSAQGKIVACLSCFAIAINVAAESIDCNEDYYYCDVGGGGYALLTRISIKLC